MKYLATTSIEQCAEKVLTSLDAFEVPVPLELVAHRLGLAVEHVPLGEGISGVLVVSGPEGSIGVNREHPEVRQRFTIAHEIGHFVLHRNQRDLFIDKAFVAFRDTRAAKGGDRSEVQANQFAAALLMPAELVKRELRDQVIDIASEDVIETLAKRFGVSNQAMIFRLGNLDLIK